MKKEGTKAYCTVEAVVLDVRTGIVPFTCAAREECQAVESSKDISFSETIEKAQREAVAKALGKVAQDVVGSLNVVS